jgi:hypothetical protein
MQIMRRWFVDRGLAVVLTTFVVYVLLAPAHVVDGDNAEFATVGALGGRAHPSGYPAYVLFLRATSWLPGASAAHTEALATVALSVLTLVCLHAACRAWGAGVGAASAVVALYGSSPVVLRMHTEAEVFGPNALIVATVLWLAASHGPLRGVARAGALGLTAGLGLGNHLTCALVAPVGLLGVVRGIREDEQPVLAVAAAVGGLLLGLSTYVYLFIADGPVSFGRVDTVSDAVDFFLRTDYGGPAAFLPGGNEPDPAANLVAVAATFGRAYLWGPAAFGVAMLFYRCVRPGAGECRAGWIALALSWTVAGPLLALRFNVDPEGLGLYVSQRFHLLPLLLMSIPVAIGLQLAGGRVAARLGSRLTSSAAITVVSVLVVLASTIASLPWLRAVHSPAMQLGVRNTLRSLPANAVVIVHSEDLCFGADYLQHVEGQRIDVVVVCWTVTSRDWYRERLAADGVTLTERFDSELSAKQAEALLATGRALFVERSHKAVAEALPSYPYGILTRVVSRGEATPSLREVVDLNRRLYESFDLDYPHPRRGDDYAAAAHRRYAATWVTLARALDHAGDAQAAADALELAARLAPARD